MHRIAFDPSLPVVAAGPFMAKGTQFAAGAPVDWRAMGVSELVALDWWRAALISHPIPALVAVVATPGETSDVMPPVTTEARTTAKPPRHARR